MFERLFALFSKVPKGLSLQLKFRKNTNGQEMLYVYLSGLVGEKHVRYERKIGIKNAIEAESEIVNELIAAAFGEQEHR